jgi:hypothetical protein
VIDVATLAAIAQSTRLALGEPRPQRPSGRAVLRAVVNKAQDLLSQITETGASWAVDEIQLQVVNGQQDYLLPVTSYFGKPLQVLTYYPQNTSTITRSIDFQYLNDMNIDWPYPQNLASWAGYYDGTPNTALRMAFYRKGGTDDMWVRVLPVPALSATYTITFAVGSWADDAGIDSSPVVNQFHPLIETQAALSLLPQTEWSNSEEENRIRRKEFKESLRYDEQGLLDGFQRYIRSLTLDHMTYRVGASEQGGLY